MKHYDIIIIGGSAAGVVSAFTASNAYPKKSIGLFRKEEKVMIPCGIPYIFGTLNSSDENIMPDQGLLNNGIEINVKEIEMVDVEGHTVTDVDGESYSYEKLVFATGSKPFIPPFIPGADLKNVFSVPKSKVYLDVLRTELADKENIIVIGAGFIGVEMADELAKTGKNISIVESREHILGGTFDDATCAVAEELMTKEGVNILTNTMVDSLVGDANGVVKTVKFKDGSTMDVDAVILSIGYRPNVELAEKSGISINKQGSIKVDAYMRTHQKDVYAAGDCAQKRDFITGKISNTMLASTATAEARIAALNLYNLNTVKTFTGTIGIYATTIGETSMGVAGITEKAAIAEGFDVITGDFKGMDRHPGKLNNGHYQYVKLIANKLTGLIIGAEVIGGVSIGELTNVIGFIIQNRMTVSDVLISQIGTQPMLTASPAKYPLIQAAEVVLRKMSE